MLLLTARYSIHWQPLPCVATIVLLVHTLPIIYPSASVNHPEALFFACMLSRNPAEQGIS